MRTRSGCRRSDRRHRDGEHRKGCYSLCVIQCSFLRSLAVGARGVLGTCGSASTWLRAYSSALSCERPRVPVSGGRLARKLTRAGRALHRLRPSQRSRSHRHALALRCRSAALAIASETLRWTLVRTWSDAQIDGSGAEADRSPQLSEKGAAVRPGRDCAAESEARRTERQLSRGCSQSANDVP